MVEGLGVQLAVDPHGFDEGGAYALWEEMVAAYLERKERAAQTTVEPTAWDATEGEADGGTTALAEKDGAERRDGEKR